MKRSASAAHVRQVVLLGAAVTLGVFALDRFGALTLMERWTWDVRFARARFVAPPASDDIRHVDIDDGAIAAVGRWPWPRSRIAGAMEEIANAGASVVALDILFSDDDAPSWRPADDGAGGEGAPRFERIDHDATLAAALGRTRAVVALNLGEPDALGPAWRSNAGREEFERLMGILRADIEAPDEVAAERARLTGERRGKFLNKPGDFRLHAAALAAAALREKRPEATLEDLIRALAPGVDENVASFPQLGTIRRAWSQRLAWEALTRTLRPSGALGAPEMDDLAPVPLLSAAAAGAGFVDFDDDVDGAVREVSPARGAATGAGLQFGLAAAALHMGVAPERVVVDAQRITIGERTIPLLRAKGGVFALDYPPTRGGWLDALRRTGEHPPKFGHVSIGRLIDLHDQRPKLERVALNLKRAAARVLDAPDAGEISDVQVEEALGRARDYLEQFEAVVAKGETLNEEERELRNILLQLRALAEEYPRGREAIATAEEEVRRALSGKLVFVGWTSTGAIADFVATPLGARTPGVVVHAVAADMALSGRATVPAPSWLGPVMTLALGMLTALLVSLLTPAPTAVAFVTLLLAHAGAGVALFNWAPFMGAPRGVGMMLPVVAPALAMVATWAGCTALEAGLSQRERKRIERQFKARVSGQLVDYLVRNPGALSMSGQQREVTSVFIDLAGFTSLSERLDGPETVRTLNQCMRALTGALTTEGAYVNKFLGDGLMAFWSAFGEDDSQAQRACRAAVGCQAALRAVNEALAQRGLSALSARIGIATGSVVVGDCGAPPDLNDYTVIGNAVNLASRLEGANKVFGSRTIIDGRTRELLGVAPDEGFALRRLGRVVVVGQTSPVDVYELMPADTPAERITLTSRGVEAFARGDYVGALAAFNTLAQGYGDARLFEAYQEAVADAAEAPAPGVIRLRGK